MVIAGVIPVARNIKPYTSAREKNQRRSLFVKNGNGTLNKWQLS